MQAFFISPLLFFPLFQHLTRFRKQSVQN
jgi:hypothetical protein